MTDTVFIAEMREWTRYPPHWIKSPVNPGDVAALIEAAEVLQRLVAATDPYGLDMEYTPFAAHTEFAAAIFRAKEVLTRFDFGDVRDG